MNEMTIAELLEAIVAATPAELANKSLEGLSAVGARMAVAMIEQGLVTITDLDKLTSAVTA